MLETPQGDHIVFISAYSELLGDSWQLHVVRQSFPAQPGAQLGPVPPEDIPAPEIIGQTGAVEDAPAKGISQDIPQRG